MAQQKISRSPRAYPTVLSVTVIETRAVLGELTAESIRRPVRPSTWIEIVIDPDAQDYRAPFLDALVQAVWPCAVVRVSGTTRCAKEIEAAMARRLRTLAAVERAS